MKVQLEQWPDAEATDEVQTWFVDWFSATGREAELAQVLLNRASASKNGDHAQHALLSWLGRISIADQEHLVQEQLAYFRALRQAKRLERVAAVAELIELAAENICRWPSAAVHQEQLQQLARLQLPADSPGKELKQAVQWLSWVRDPSSTVQAVPPELLNWEPENVPSSIREGLARALIDAIDQRPSDEHIPWVQTLKLNEQWSGWLLESPRLRSRAAGFRLMAWSGDLSAALDGLKRLSDQAGRGGGAIQLELANALVDSGANRWEDSTRIAQAIVANSPAGSELHWAARWRLLRNQVLLGQTDVARRSAQLILASQPPESEVWRTRLEEMAR